MMSLGILKRFREKKYNFFKILTLVPKFRDFSIYPRVRTSIDKLNVESTIPTSKSK